MVLEFLNMWSLKSETENVRNIKNENHRCRNYLLSSLFISVFWMLMCFVCKHSYLINAYYWWKYKWNHHKFTFKWINSWVSYLQFYLWNEILHESYSVENSALHWDLSINIITMLIHSNHCDLLSLGILLMAAKTR